MTRVDCFGFIEGAGPIVVIFKDGLSLNKSPKKVYQTLLLLLLASAFRVPIRHHPLTFTKIIDYNDDTVMHAVFLFLFFVNTSRIFLILNSCLSHAF
jgi:hypothetical protein